MSRLLAVVFALAIMLAAVPTAFAQEVPVEEPTESTTPEIVACENPDGLEVITREGLESTIATPSFLIGNEFEPKEFLVDLQATSTLATATITSVMSWTNVANDYDLQGDSATASAISENYQPEDAPDETVALAKVAHCEVITLTAIDFLAPVAVDAASPVLLDPLALDITVTKFVEPVVTAPAA